MKSHGALLMGSVALVAGLALLLFLDAPASHERSELVVRRAPAVVELPPAQPEPEPEPKPEPKPEPTETKAVPETVKALKGPGAGGFPAGRNRWLNRAGLPLQTAVSVLTLEHALHLSQGRVFDRLGASGVVYSGVPEDDAREGGLLCMG